MAEGLIAQSYNTAMGMRFGTEIGLTMQQRLTKKVTAEAIFQSSIKNEQSSLTLLLEKHNNILGKGFNIYMGAGPHRTWYTSEESGATTATGLTGVAGAELTLGRINMSWDYKPQVNVWGGEKSFDSNTAISLRYVLVKKKKNPLINLSGDKKKKKQKQKEKRKRKKFKEKQKRKKK